MTHPDVRIVLSPSSKKHHKPVYSRDVIIAPNLYCDEDDLTIYDKLLEEMKNCKVDDKRLWKSWHGNNHLIADDGTGW